MQGLGDLALNILIWRFCFMAKLIGFEAKTFTFEDGKTVTGFYLFTSEKRQGVTGESCSRDFVSTAKIGGYVPVLGDNITINYNRYGKPQSVIKN